MAPSGHTLSSIYNNFARKFHAADITTQPALQGLPALKYRKSVQPKIISSSRQISVSIDLLLPQNSQSKWVGYSLACHGQPITEVRTQI